MSKELLGWGAALCETTPAVKQVCQPCPPPFFFKTDNLQPFTNKQKLCYNVGIKLLNLNLALA